MSELETYQIVLLFIFSGALLGCLKNIIIGESVMVFSIVSLSISELKIMHPAMGVAIGIIAGLLLYTLIITFRAVRYILTVLFSAGFSALIWFSCSEDNVDKGWTIFWTVLVFVVAICLHVAAWQSILDEEYQDYLREENRRWKKKQGYFDNSYSNSYNRDGYFYTFHKSKQKETSEQESHYEYNQADYQNNVHSDPGKDYYMELFQNCDSIDDLKKRYRDLMKIFHPDNQNGSDEHSKGIQNAYEKILQEKFPES